MHDKRVCQLQNGIILNVCDIIGVQTCPGMTRTLGIKKDPK